MKKAGAPWKGLLLLAGGLLLGLGLGALVFFGGGETDAAPRRPLTVGAEAPDFSLATLTGERLSLSALRGKPVVLNFWATWCAPCKEEMPLLQETSQRYGSDLTVLGVNIGEQPEEVAPFVDALGITFPVLLDPNEQIALLFFVRNMPVTYFLDAQGVVRAQHTGMLLPAQLDRYLQTIGLPESAGGP
jgi:thiol-disulfide isomerase/thioredoxin